MNFDKASLNQSYRTKQANTRDIMDEKLSRSIPCTLLIDNAPKTLSYLEDSEL
jgi:hypothetical protein